MFQTFSRNDLSGEANKGKKIHALSDARALHPPFEEIIFFDIFRYFSFSFGALGHATLVNCFLRTGYVSFLNGSLILCSTGG